MNATEIDKARGCHLIASDRTRYVLGPEDEQEARTWLTAYEGEEPTKVVDVGWMRDTGWDRDTYALKREFDAESGYCGWWAGCLPPADGKQGKKCKRAWEIVR